MRRVKTEPSVDLLNGVENMCPDKTNLVGVVQLEQPRKGSSRGVDVLMAVIRSSHAQSRVHVNVMTRKIETDQTLKHNAPPGKG